MKRMGKHVLTSCLILLCAVLAGLAPSGSFTVGPGPVVPLYDAVYIGGHEAQGRAVHMVSVMAREARIIDLVMAGFRPSLDVVSSEWVYGGMDPDEFSAQSRAAMEQSQMTAIYVALRECGYDVLPGDPWPFPVEVRGGEVTGPSAGLAFALEIALRVLDRLPETGERIAATGVLDERGNVGAVGGVGHKALACSGAGIDVFIVPSANRNEACRAAGDMLVVGVETFHEALRYLLGDDIP